MRLPQTLRDNNNPRSARTIFFGVERTAHERDRTEYAKVVRRYVDSLDLLGTIATTQIQSWRLEVVRGNRVDGLCSRPRHVLGNGRDTLRIALKFPTHPHETARVGIRKRLQKDCAHDREGRRVRTDPKRKRRDGNEREAWVLGDRPRGVLHVGNYSIHD